VTRALVSLIRIKVEKFGKSGQVTVIFEMAQPAEIAPLITQAYQLTKREGEIAQCALHGWSTAEIATKLPISANTVQDHLKAIFEKVDVGSRGELAAHLYATVPATPRSRRRLSYSWLLHIGRNPN
jgi:DNA-binding NarL/FixJ family response regulator